MYSLLTCRQQFVACELTLDSVAGLIPKFNAKDEVVVATV